ncbi:MAG TPA: hypothetical protein VFJ20_07790 [Gemmatimonadaceae bacterium]|nr:hypothetical protein [Gemmatimonadaceae bacterium]
MLVELTRRERRPYYSTIFVEGSTLFVDDEGKLTRKKLESPAAALAEHGKLLARREKSGWRAGSPVSTPWLDFRGELEKLHERVLADARAAKVAVGPRSAFSRRGKGDGKLPEDYAGFARIGAAQLAFHLGDAKLAFAIEFEVGNAHAGKYWVADGTDDLWFWRRTSNGSPDDGGTFEKTKLVSRVGDERIVHASAAEFRAWFPRYVRDDVMSFSIAELAR